MKLAYRLTLLAFVLTGCHHAPAPESSTNQPVAVVPAPAPAPAPAPPVDDRLPEALKLKDAGKLLESRALLQELASNDPACVALGDINSQIIFSAMPAPEKVDYTIQAGDTLAKLASRYGTTVDLLRKANHISGDKIRLGDRLRIYQGQFAVEVSKSANTLTVTDHDKFFKRYRVGTGQFSKTPVGDFKISTRIENPPWYRPDGQTVPYGDPDNILGTHWLGLNIRGYGLHGTWETNSIGKQSSAGCIRLLNDDIAELYLLLPVGTPVTIHD